MKQALSSIFRLGCVWVCLTACSGQDSDTPAPGATTDDLPTIAEPGSGPLLAVFGDSIATGVLANTQLGTNLDESIARQLLSILGGDLNDKEEVQEKLSQPDLAAATTSSATGIRAAIGAQKGLSADAVPVVSLARFGARALDMETMQAELLAQEQGTLGRQVDHIFVMLGGNDFCSEATPEEFQSTFQTQMDKLKASHPQAAYTIGPVPPIQQMAALDHTYGPSIPILTGEEITCKKLRERACPRIYAADAAERVAALNSSIRGVYEQMKAGGFNVTWVQGIADWTIEPSDLAIDCFHPSAQGQEKIGQFIKAALP